MSHLPRILGLALAIACTCATLAFAAQVAPGSSKQAVERSGIIVLESEQGKDGTLPPVAFDHDAHTKSLAKSGNTSIDTTCASCHTSTNGKMVSDFKDTGGKEGADRENAFHDGCVSCHAGMKAKKMETGPQKAECRSCHDKNSLPASGKTSKGVDGGLDAGLHARHIASEAIPGSMGNANCASCHHPVQQLSSPALKAESCRSCHGETASKQSSAPAANPGDGKKVPPAYADIAHGTCISCHQASLAKGVAAPITCESCHDAAVKAKYAKPNPVPRLDAGQPRALMLGVAQEVPSDALPSDGAAPAEKASSRPPVAFNHALHEKATDSCISCHHKTIQSCSSCHTSTGSPKGGNVTLNQAMHMPTSDRSCVGCHEVQKTKLHCAGCHATMPKRKPVDTCASCHTPPASGAGRVMDMAPVPPTSSFIPPKTLRLPGTAKMPGALSPEQVRANRMALAITADRTKNATFSGLEAAPDKVTIGAMSNEYEPVIFPHGEHVKALAASIKYTAKGMTAFHTKEFALCASCHHNSPLSATPPTCASCHAKESKDKKLTAHSDGRPMLKAAYHQQCMSCHATMKLKKPANTDCASCHAKRAPR